eukprot:g5975.t1
MSSIGDTQLPANRRGGYGDGGGLTVDNKLPLAEAVSLSNEGALKKELDAIGRSLGSTVDWVERIQAIIRLEGLILGGATQWPSFLELLRNLKDPLVAQICDRRSAVSRQACHVISVLVSYLGIKFDHMAIFFIPVLIKVLTITVQVMAEAADECIQWILHYCRSGKLLPKIVDCIVSEKCSKIRQHCIKYLLQVFDNWSPKQYERYVEFTFPGLRASLQDASSETREIGRMAVASLCQAFPEKGRTLVKTLDGSLQKKLASVIRSYKGKEVIAGSNAFETPNKTSLTQNPSTKLTEIKSVPDKQSKDLMEDVSASPEGSLKELRLHDDPQKLHFPSQGTGPSRLIKNEDTNKNFTHSGIQQEIPDQSNKEEDSGPRRLLIESSELTNNPGLVKLTLEGKSPSFSALMKQALSQGNDWRIKEEILNQLIFQFEKQMILSPELIQSIQTLSQVFSVFLQDPHHKVVSLTLSLIAQFAKQHEALMESVFNKLAPLLFAKLVDGKAHIRNAASAILQNCVKFCSVETLLGTCVSTIAAMRIPRVVPEIMNYSIVFVNNQNTNSLQGITVRQWICQLCNFISDKNPATRKSASDALEHFMNSIPQMLLKEHLSSADPQEQLILVRNLKQRYSEFLPDFFSVIRTVTKEGNKSAEVMDTVEEKTPIRKQEADRRILESLYLCRNMKEVEKLDALTSLTEKLCFSAFTSTQVFETEVSQKLFNLSSKFLSSMKILDESLGLFMKSGSAVREQILIFLNDLILLKELSVPLPDECKLFKFLISAKTDESNLVCLAMDVILDTLLREIPPFTSFDLCLSCFLSLNPATIVSHQFLRLVKVFSRLICFLDNKLVEKKLSDRNFQIIQLLVKQWNSDKVDVRKAVVCCLAQIGNKMPQK